MQKFSEFITEGSNIIGKIEKFLKSKGAEIERVFKSNGPEYKGIGFSYGHSTNSDDWITEFAKKFEKEVQNEFILTPESITITVFKKGRYNEWKNELLYPEWEKLK
jgi:hypothetical protein